MSSSLVRSTYRRMMKYLLRHWCMEIKCDGNNTTSRNTKKNGQNGCQKSNGHDTQSSNNENKICQMTQSNLDKRLDDGILLDAQLEWEHEAGIEHSPRPYRKSEQDLLDIILTQSPRSISSTTYIRTPYCSDFEWDNLFDFAL
ncbi:unnamed protein product [Rotaria sp. Silwood1]|nr:unnamed protein product [Rotaria sp. Silwood1]CAF1300200.1 unnamed protein product [Rotaria sp. Silwood1]CAF3490697.1 unnamed protein product [Rotaria sp. Silwood1]CAF3517258.1 unnamed protein product [Rotaria sp. Silwood1]CAF3546056.1 unnamed protein product [Rotaria sp. Silwood1]